MILKPCGTRYFSIFIIPSHTHFMYMEHIPMAHSTWSDVDVESPWHDTRHAQQNSASPSCQYVVLASRRDESCMTGPHKIIEEIPRVVKIGGVVSTNPTIWWSLSAKKLLAAHLRLCDKLVVVPRVSPVHRSTYLPQLEVLCPTDRQGCRIPKPDISTVW
jgi:hypothetical protein